MGNVTIYGGSGSGSGGGCQSVTVADINDPSEIESLSGTTSCPFLLALLNDTIVATETLFAWDGAAVAGTNINGKLHYHTSGTGAWIAVGGAHCYQGSLLANINDTLSLSYSPAPPKTLATSVFGGKTTARVVDVYPNAKFYCTEFVGGGATALDSIDTANITDGDIAIVAKNGLWVYHANLNGQYAEALFTNDRGYKVITPDTDTGTAKPNLRWVCVRAEDPVGESYYNLISHVDNNTARTIWIVVSPDSNNATWYEYLNIKARYTLWEMVRTTYLSLSLSGVDGITLASAAGYVGGLINTSTGTNAMPFQQRVHGARDWPFVGINLGANTNGVLYAIGQNAEYIVATRAGYLTGISCTLTSGPITAGTLTIEPTIAGTAVTPSGLDLVLEGGTPGDSDGYATVSPGTSGYSFSAGAHIGIKWTTNAAYSPTTIDPTVLLEIVYNP